MYKEDQASADLYPHQLSATIDRLRTYTDPTSNAVANTLVDPLDIQEELAGRCLSTSLLNVVLHETTHFTTYFTPVGAALASLRGATIADPIGLSLDHERMAGPAKTVIAADALHHLFTPLVEGLAVFAEFDALPGNSDIASTPTTVIGCLFGKKQISALPVGGRRDPFLAAEIISQARLSPEGRDRKVMLYQSALSRQDGYLCGYLWVKRLWAQLVQADRRLEDTDLFLCFLIDYIFSDFTLAHYVQLPIWGQLSAEELPSYLRSIGHYVFTSRMVDLIRNPTSFVDEFEHYMKDARLGNIQTLASQRWRPKYQNFDAQDNFQLELGMSFGALRTLNYRWPNYLAGRQVLRLFGSPANIELGEDGRYRATSRKSGKIISGRSLEQARPSDRSAVSCTGTIEALFLTSQVRPIIAVFIDHELMATLDPATGEENDTQAVEACDDLTSYLRLEMAAVEMRDETHFSPETRAARTRTECLDEVDSVLASLFEGVALSADDGGDPKPETLQSLRSGGVKALLREDHVKVEWLAALSLSAAGQDVTMADAARHWGVDSPTVEAWYSEVQSSLQRHLGKNAFQRTGNVFYWSQF